MQESHSLRIITYFIFLAKLENIASFLNIFITEVMNGNEVFYFIFYLFMNIIYLHNYSARRGRVRL